MMRRLVTLFSVLSIVALSHTALAADGDGKTGAKIAEHQWGMNFAIPTGNKGSAGILYVLTPKMLLELDVGFSYQKDKFINDQGEKEGLWGYLLAPGIRYYFMGSGPVNVYIKGALQYADNKEQDAQVSLMGGLGVEWFVTKYFSIGGDTGLGFQLMPSDNFGVGTISHGLSANIYW